MAEENKARVQRFFDEVLRKGNPVVIADRP